MLSCEPDDLGLGEDKGVSQAGRFHLDLRVFLVPVDKDPMFIIAHPRPNDTHIGIRLYTRKEYACSL